MVVCWPAVLPYRWHARTWHIEGKLCKAVKARTSLDKPSRFKLSIAAEGALSAVAPMGEERLAWRRSRMLRWCNGVRTKRDLVHENLALTGTVNVPS